MGSRWNPRAVVTAIALLPSWASGRGGTVDRGRRFPLTRYFVVTGLATAVVVAAVLTTLSVREVHADLVDKSEDYAVLIARNLNRQVHERFVRPTIARDGYIDLDRPEHLAALDAVVRLAIAELDVRSVYFFDLEGRIVYSTQLEHRGFTVGNNENYWRARRGTPSTLLVSRGSPLDVSGQPGAVPLLESYVPVEQLDGAGRPAGQSGVIEVYQDATELLHETRRAGLRVVAMSVAGVLSLMLTLWLWIRKAERAIDERSAALVRANEQLEALSHDLERQVEERTTQLIRAKTLATVGTLSAGVAHEVNNPVASIASCAEGLLRRLRRGDGAGDPDELREYLQIIRDEAFRVKEITRNLLDFSRSGGVERRAPVDLGAVVRAAAQLVHYRAQREQKELVLDLGEAPVVIEGDAASLRQLVLNVTVNAIDATPPGSEVRWTLRPAADGAATLECDDAGPGFAPEERERAFEPFFTRKPTGQGTGLGLAISWSVVQKHGGRIELGAARGGQGARVSVWLPARPPEERDDRAG